MEDKVFSSLIQVVRSMVLEGRCPWMRRQSLLSITESLAEESQEFSEAVVEAKPKKEVISEAGDVLTLTLALCFLLEREGMCSVGEIINEAIAKLRRRAPYIFQEGTHPVSIEEAAYLWELAKCKEKENQE